MGLTRIGAFAGAIAASLLPHRLWGRLPASLPVETAAFASGLLTLLGGAAIGIPGFLDHAGASASIGTAAVMAAESGNRQVALSPAFNGLAIFTFLLLTPKGWATLYLMIGGGLRMAAAWFDDPLGDPILTGLDALAAGGWARARDDRERAARESLEGPETADRVVSSSAAGIPGCDLVVVASRRKPGWEHGAAVFTQDKCYRIGQPVERTIAGRLRMLYPLTEHADHEVIRKSVRYDLPDRAALP